MVRISSPKDFLAGLLFVGIALAGLYIGREYPVGLALRMGPGYIPRLLLMALLGLGLVIAIRGVTIEDADEGGWAWRPLIVIPGAMLLFGLTIERFGLVIATLAVVLASSFAWSRFRITETLAVATGLALFAVAVFVWGLRLNIPVWPI